MDALVDDLTQNFKGSPQGPQFYPLIYGEMLSRAAQYAHVVSTDFHDYGAVLRFDDPEGRMVEVSFVTGAPLGSGKYGSQYDVKSISIQICVGKEIVTPFRSICASDLESTGVCQVIDELFAGILPGTTDYLAQIRSSRSPGSRSR